MSSPAADEGTSESTLSVETSKRGSSWATLSPTCFSQRMIVPSVTVSPSCGIVMSANVESPSGKCEHRFPEGLGERRMRLYELRDLVRRRLPVDRQVGLTELLGHPRTDHVHTEKATRSPSGPFSAMTFTSPSVSPRIRGSAVAAEGSFFDHDLERRHRAACSVMPTKATSGWQ